MLSGGTLHSLEADAPAVGMMPEMPFDTRSVGVAENARLIVFSDGILEIEKRDGSMWPWTDFLHRMKEEMTLDGDLIERHLEYVRDLGGKEVLSDDFSMLDVRFGAPVPAARPAPGA